MSQSKAKLSTKRKTPRSSHPLLRKMKYPAPRNGAGFRVYNLPGLNWGGGAISPSCKRIPWLVSSSIILCLVVKAVSGVKVTMTENSSLKRIRIWILSLEKCLTSATASDNRASCQFRQGDAWRALGSRSRRRDSLLTCIIEKSIAMIFLNDRTRPSTTALSLAMYSPLCSVE